MPVLLLLAGAAVAWLAEAGSAREGSLAGPRVVPGYLVVATGGTFLPAHPIGDTGASIAPGPVSGLLVAGVV